MLQECLLDLGFIPPLAESSIYMLKCPTADHYEYMAMYIDDLAILMKDHQVFIDLLEAAPYNFKLKGSRHQNFHLAFGFYLDSTGTLCINPGKHIG